MMVLFFGVSWLNKVDMFYPFNIPIISTLLFQIIIFERYSRSKIITIQTFPSLVVNNMLTVVVEK